MNKFSLVGGTFVSGIFEATIEKFRYIACRHFLKRKNKKYNFKKLVM